MATIRTTKPSTDNKYYIQTAGGGYNKCIQGNANNPYERRPTKYSVLPNCVGYAYGRYLEFYGLKSADLPTCNAKDWYAAAKKNGFKCNYTPTVGSLIVFGGGECGHIAFVERIESNGDLFLSESNWGHEFFKNRTVKKVNSYALSSAYPCIGFIANPNVKPEAPKKSDFLPARGYFKKGDNSANVGKIASFMRRVFPAYTDKKALGNTYGPYLISAVKTFQKATGLEADGNIGPITLAELKKYGFKEN